MEAIAHSRFQRMGARKVAQVLSEIRGRSVLKAEMILPTLPRMCARMVERTVKSAAANLAMKLARAGKPLVADKVRVSACWVGNGPLSQMRRVRPAPMGRAMTFKRKLCHLTVVVSDGEGASNHGS